MNLEQILKSLAEHLPAKPTSLKPSSVKTSSDPEIQEAIRMAARGKSSDASRSPGQAVFKNFRILSGLMGKKEATALSKANNAFTAEEKNAVYVAELRSRGHAPYGETESKIPTVNPKTEKPTVIVSRIQEVASAVQNVAQEFSMNDTAQVAPPAPSLATLRGVYQAAFGYAHNATHDTGEQGEYEAIRAALYETAIEVPGLSYEALSSSGTYQRETTSGRAKSSHAMSQKAVDRFLAANPNNSTTNLSAEKTAGLTGRARFNASIKIK